MRQIKLKTLTHLLLCLFIPAFSLASPPLVMEQGQSKYPISEYLSYVEDPKGKLDVEDILNGSLDERFKQNYAKVINFGITDSVYWFRGSVDTSNYSSEQVPVVHENKWFLDIAFPVFKYIDLYIIEEGEVVEHQIRSKNELVRKQVPVSDELRAQASSVQSHSLNFNSEKRNHRNFIFNFDIADKQSVDFILRVEPTIRMFLPITLWEAETFVISENKILYITGFLFGLMVFLALYNILVYLVVKDISYLYFVAYMMSMMAFFLSMNGQGDQYIWNRFFNLSTIISLFAANIGLAFILMFARSFIGVRNYSITLDRILLSGVFALVVQSLLTLFDQLAMIYFTAVFSSLNILLVLYISYYCARQGSEMAKVFVVSFATLLVAALIYALSVFNIIPVNSFTDNLLYFGTLLQVTALSVGLANQINIDRRERYFALTREHQAVQSLETMETDAVAKAMLDPVTGFPNRACLQDFIDRIIGNENVHKQRMAILVVQLHGFHEINHTLGFHNGDAILVKVAKRLNRLVADDKDTIAIRENDFEQQYVAVIENGCFAIFFNMTKDKSQTLDGGKHLMELLNRPVGFHGMNLDVLAKGGVAFAPEHSTNIFTLLRFAQIASETNSPSENLLDAYSPTVDNYTSRRLAILGDLRQSIGTSGLFLNFQPQINLDSEKVVGVEALARWLHPQFGMVAPDEFIPLAEKTGIIHQLTEWLLDESFSCLSELNSRGVDIRMSINISVKNLLEKGFVDKVLAAFERVKIPYSSVILEITETAMMADPKNALAVLHQLSSHGILIAMDDFGSGYSSLSYIKQLPLSEIKIDREFINEIEHDQYNQVITKNTIAMSHNLGFKVCAEGVETRESYDLLRKYNCDLVQGYYLAKPMDLKALFKWIADSPFGLEDALQTLSDA